MEKELLEAIRQIIKEENAPIVAAQRELAANQKKLEEKFDYLSGVVEESLVLHDELEQRVKRLEDQAV